MAPCEKSLETDGKLIESTYQCQPSEKSIADEKLSPGRLSRPKTIDDVLRIVGPMGRWQMQAYFWVFLFQSFTGLLSMAVVFFQLTPQHTCKLHVENNWSFGEIQKLKLVRFISFSEIIFS